MYGLPWVKRQLQLKFIKATLAINKVTSVESSVWWNLGSVSWLCVLFFNDFVWSESPNRHKHKKKQSGSRGNIDGHRKKSKNYGVLWPHFCVVAEKIRRGPTCGPSNSRTCWDPDHTAPQESTIKTLTQAKPLVVGYVFKGSRGSNFRILFWRIEEGNKTYTTQQNISVFGPARGPNENFFSWGKGSLTEEKKHVFSRKKNHTYDENHPSKIFLLMIIFFFRFCLCRIHFSHFFTSVWNSICVYTG